MNSNKIKKKKEDIFLSNSMNDNPEVLVLPPNLLEKLGINLGNIQPDIDNSINTSCTEILDGKVSTPFTGKPSKAMDKLCMNSSSKDTSILKTANLMKESVLLSPTFSAFTPCELLNEEEVNYLNDSEKSIEDNQIYPEIPKFIESSSHKRYTEQVKEHKKSLDFMEIAKDNINNRVNDMQKPIDVIILNSEFQTDMSKPNNQLPDAYVFSENSEPDKSTKNLNPKTTLAPKKEINILSQEILNAEKIKQLKKYHSTEKSILIPVKIDTTLCKNNTNTTVKILQKKIESPSSLINDQQNIANGINKVDVIRYMNKQLISKIREDESLKKDYISSDTLVNISNSASNEELKSTDFEQTNYLTIVNGDNQSCLRNIELSNLTCTKDISKENVEIKTLRINFQSQQLIHNSDDAINNKKLSIPTKSLLDDIEYIDCVNNVNNINKGEDCKDKKFISEENIVTSKLCIQGVEKPGGKVEVFCKNVNIHHLKTYSKAKKTKSYNPKVTNSGHCIENTIDIDYKINEPKIDTKNFPKFCICKDFGSFDCEIDKSYEHVHFLKQPGVQCSLENLFSIYEDNVIEESIKEEKCFQYINGHFDEEFVVNESFNSNICWHNIENVYKNINFDNYIFSTKYNQLEMTSYDESSIDFNLGNDDSHLQIIPNRGYDKDKNIQSEKNTKIDEPSKELSKNIDCFKIENPIHDHISKTAEEYDSSKNICQQESNKNTAKKRKRSSTSESDNDKISAKKLTETITCELCGDRVAKIDWENHVSKKHCFIAWTEGQTINFEDKKLLLKLNRRLCDTGKLVCTFCDAEQNELKKFISHVNKCMDKRCSSNKYNTPMRTRNTDIEIDQSASKAADRLICGVCQREVEENLWFDHIGKEHNYLAWEQGSQPLDLTDEDKIVNFLKITMKTIGRLECSYCGIKRTYVKSYISHMKNCANIELLSPESALYTENENHSQKSEYLEGNGSKLEECGVCHIKVEDDKWIDHISKEHCYLAWKEGEQELDVNDAQEVHDHLYCLSKDNDGLICSKCGVRRKYVKSYLTHIQNCSGPSTSQNTTLETTQDESSVFDLNDTTIDEGDDGEKNVKCGVCHKELQKKYWLNHIQTEHAYVAWKERQAALCSSNKYNTPMRTRNMDTEIDQPSSKAADRLICGVCQNEVEENLWFDHIGKEHNYLAWEQGAQPLDLTDEDKILNFLKMTRKTIGQLECSYCGIKRTHVKSYISHIKNCANIELLSPELYTENENRVQKSQNLECNVNKIDECGVCHIKVENEKWIDHISKEHCYLAWKEGEQELDVNDAQEVHDHLYCLSKDNDGLICSKCGVRRKYVKSYLTHIQNCSGPSTSQNTTLETTQDESSVFDLNDTTIDEGDDGEKNVVCGVCHKELQQKYWLNHIQMEHAYVAWKEGQAALNLDNREELLQHLQNMNKKYNGLVCNKCGITRKYVKVYLSHIESCDSTFASNATLKEEGKDSYKCAVCAEEVDSKDWKSHAMNKHYNVAWVDGDFPIDVKNPNAVENYLKEYKKYNKKLECLRCGVSRVSVIGFYAHVIQCGKSEEEIEEYKSYCDICNSKYLCIYKNQHLQTHREQEYAKERKKLIESKLKLDSDCENETQSVTEGRKAAKRARNFIGKYQKFEYNCSCGFGADDENELENHECGKTEHRNYSDSEESAHIDLSSGDESENTDIDSNISASDTDLTRDILRKHGGESRSFATRIRRIPFDVKNPKAFLSQSAEEFRKIHYTNDTLYPQWRNCKYKMVPDNEISKYMPPLDKSCKLLISQDDWKTLNKFEAIKENGGYTVFVGGSIHCVSWAGGAAERHFLAVSCHNDSDCPRLDSALSYCHANMLQIWDFGDLTTSDPKFVLGIAHEYGTVWSIDWCASGVRDNLLEHSKTFQRLGLLAVACSNGSAYIFSVPYPSTITDSDKVVYNLPPVAELKLTQGERKKFQATAISWSPQRGHSVVLVGYSDGTTALFDLEGDSPLLKETVDGMDIFYPYHDERSHNTAITGVSAGAGAASSASPTGAESARRGAAAVRLRAHLPCSAVVHSPHWPSAMLAENDGLVTQAVNELDWWGWGQRLGAVSACGTCAACGALAAYAPPLLRLMTPHPAFAALNKEPVAFINMTPLAKKRTKQKTDELAIKLEPRTYEEAVKTYGIEFKFIKELDKNHLQQINNKPKEYCHERFPLSDIPSMAFNPSPKHHRKLAVATHAGVIFVITV